MALTPADVHNVAFSKPRIGKRGYSEEEVDLFLDLIEEELVSHIERNTELGCRNAELRNRVAGLDKREAELAERHAELVQRHAAVNQRERQVGEQEARLCQQEAAIARREARLRQLETELAQRHAAVSQRERQVGRQEARLREHEAESRELRDRPEPVRPFCVNSDAALYHMTQSHQPAPQHVVANGPLHSESGRTVSAVHGRHHMERTAIRAVTDILGNRMTETVCEWMRTSTINHTSSELASEAAPPLQELMQENAELTRSNGILKAAAALLAAELDRQ